MFFDGPGFSYNFETETTDMNNATDMKPQLQYNHNTNTKLKVLA